MIVREAAKEARNCAKVCSFIEDSGGQLRICVIRCAEATVGKVACVIMVAVIASAKRFFGCSVHDMRQERHVRYQEVVDPGPYQELTSARLSDGEDCWVVVDMLWIVKPSLQSMDWGEEFVKQNKRYVAGWQSKPR